MKNKFKKIVTRWEGLGTYKLATPNEIVQDMRFLIDSVIELSETLKKARLTVLIFKDMADKNGWDFNVDKELKPIEEAISKHGHSY